MIPNLLAGVLGLMGISGVGRLLIRPLRPLALHWYAALAMLAGVALSSFSAQCLAIVGSGRTGFRVLGLTIVVLGAAGHWAGRGRYSGLPWPRPGRLRTFALGFLCLVVVVLAAISLAPSTKIDELYYHMLTGRRVLEDHGLRVYQLPAEQAIVPQMGYQIAQTVFHATGTIDAGNVVSLGFGLVLWILIYGVVAEEAHNPQAGLLAAVAGIVGLYPAVWHVTAGPHALGDLATFSAVAALLFPGGLGGTHDKTRSFAGVLGAACAASTKISLVPVAGLITVAIILRLRGAARVQMGAVAVGVWLVVLGPLVAWTTYHTGSPFGAAFAQAFDRTAYQQVVFQALEDARLGSQTGFGPAVWSAVQSLNGVSLLLLMAGMLACLRRWKQLAPLFVLVALQLLLITIALPHNFRFLGGLQYGLLVAGVIGLDPLWNARIPPKWIGVAALILLGPWLAAELYYSRPFVAVDLGLMTREDFLDRYVAFRDDFRALDRILPRDAKLYVPNTRLPAVYAPRPVIFTLADWDQRTPLYRFLAFDSGEQPDVLGLEPQADLNCSGEVYRNPAANVVTYRTPGRAPVKGTVMVQLCFPVSGHS